MIGETLGHYRIESKLGEGGMGVVYKAFDTHLDRPVAIKVLPAEAVADPERKRRFVQEAKAASALNHPNIITIHDIATEDGADFIVMEYVAGQSLDACIGHKGLPLAETLKYAVQIADALARAHGAGIVHRDLKPANIMVTGPASGHPGLVKVLDFGLAKLTERDEYDERTLTLERAPRTEEGMIVGTVAFMSPEQAQGKKVDARSDIFSLGSVLYEMLAGQRAFQGENRISTLAAILNQEPKPVSQVTPAVPRDLERIVSRCLRKDPDRRFQTAADLKVALLEIKEESESGKLAGPAIAAPPRRSVSAPVIAAAALLVAVAAGVTWWLTRTQRQEPHKELVLTRMTSDSGLTTDAAISPDGKLLAYASDRGSEDNLDIWVQQVAGGQAIRLTHDPADDHAPAFSPDGSKIVFRSEREGGGIYVVPTLGGDERLIAKSGDRPRFSPDGNWIAYSIGLGLRTAKIYIVSSAGGEPRELKTQLPWAMLPVWSPDGKCLLFFGSTDPSGIAGTQDWWVAPSEGGQAVQAVQAGARAAFGRQKMGFPLAHEWTKDRIIFSAFLGDSRNLWQVPISPGNWQVSGPPQRLTTGSGRESSASVAADGRLVFADTSGTSGLWSLSIDANAGKVLGKPQSLSAGRADNLRPSLSSDGKKLVFISNRSGNADVWMRDLDSGKEAALTATPEGELNPFITADGSRVAYASIAQGKSVLYVINVGKGIAQKVCEDCGRPMDWSPDGRKILYWWGQPVRYSAIDLATRQRVDVVHHPRYNIHRARFSPDGNWLAFHVPIVAEAGRSPIFIAPLRNGVASGESEWIQATDGSGVDAAPWWSPDGSILYFLSQRDGFQCVWAQHLDKVTKRPVGPPFDFYHFHGARHKVNEAGFGPGLTNDKMIFCLSETTGNIWMAKPQ